MKYYLPGIGETIRDARPLGVPDQMHGWLAAEYFATKHWRRQGPTADGILEEVPIVLLSEDGMHSEWWVVRVEQVVQFTAHRRAEGGKATEAVRLAKESAEKAKENP